MNGSRATLRDVADRAGVSIGTVSNVLNTPSVVADDTRLRVEKAISEIGYVRDGAARQLRGGRSYAIGLVVFDVGNPHFATVARAVEDTVRDLGYVVILCDGAGSVDREQRHLALLEEQRVAGILYTAVDNRESRSVSRLRERGVPVVRIGVLRGRREWCCVATDHVHGGQIAAEHLVGLGHTQIGMIGGPPSFVPNVERRRGFERTLTEAGLRLSERHDVETQEMTMAAGEQAARRLFAAKRRPTAVYCHNDLLGLGTLRALTDMGLRVPSDVAVLGDDDIPFAAMSMVPLSSIRPRTYEVAQTAAELLLEEMRGDAHAHQRIALEPDLVVRASTASSEAVQRERR
jgi:LacI family transcriptional regulator